MTDWVTVEPLVDQPEQREYWTPLFQVGDRVRVRLSGECPARGPYRDRNGVLTQDVPMHRGTNGCIGVVAKCPKTGLERCDVFPGHPITVRKIATPDGLRGGHFAACELEPAP